MSLDFKTGETEPYASISTSYNDETTGEFKLNVQDLGLNVLSLVGNIGQGYFEVSVGTSGFRGEIGIFYEKSDHFEHLMTNCSPADRAQVSAATNSTAGLLKIKDLTDQQQQVRKAYGEFVGKALKEADLTQEERDVMMMMTSPDDQSHDNGPIIKRILDLAVNKAGPQLGLQPLLDAVHAANEEVQLTKFEQQIESCAKVDSNQK